MTDLSWYCYHLFQTNKVSPNGT